MKYSPLIVLTLFWCFDCFSQSDTATRRQVKGFLFLADYNYQYDWSGQEMNPLGFHDYFFPSTCPLILCMSDSNLAIVFKGGIRIDHIKNRKPLKEKAVTFYGSDSSECYRHEKFYVLPVIIDYKEFDDGWPPVCSTSYFEIAVTKGSKIRFEYTRRAMLPLKILSGVDKLKK